MWSQRATRHHYLGRLILATMATAIAISLGLTAFGTLVPASAAESEVAAENRHTVSVRSIVQYIYQAGTQPLNIRHT